MKRYRDWRRWLIVFLLSLLLPCSLLILVLSILALIDSSLDLFTKLEAIGCLALGIGIIVLCFKVLIPTMTGVLEIDQNIIRYCLAFKKDIVLRTEDCTYVGVRTIRYSDQSAPFVLNGFQSSFIYLSEKPLDAKANQNILSSSPKKGYIYFPYSDEICLHLIKVLPVSKTRSLEGFYNQRQDEKRQLEKEKARKKRRKEKEKQKKKDKK